MKNKQRWGLIFLMGAFLSFSSLEANAGFSRQMEMDCMACHHQTMNQLNAFGRKFAASGFTMSSGNASMIDGESMKLGLPLAFNASVLLTARYNKTTPIPSDEAEDFSTERGNLEVFKVSKLFLGGKIAQNVGGVMYLMVDSFGGKVHFTSELDSGYAGATLYMDKDNGPFSGMEYFNTGLYDPLQLFENRKSANAAQATDLGHGPATGLQAYYGGDTFFLTAGGYIPAISQHEGLDSGTSGVGIARIAYAPTIGDWTIMVGAYALGGTARLSDAALDGNQTYGSSTPNLIDITREAYGFDVQIEGEIEGMNTVLVLQNVLHNKTKLYNNTLDDPRDKLIYTDLQYNAGDNKAFSAEVQINPWEPLGIKLAYLTYDDAYDYRYSGTSAAQLIDRQDRDDYSIGLDYNFRQNVRFAFEYTYSDIRINNQEKNGNNVSLPDSDNFLFFATIGF